MRSSGIADERRKVIMAGLLGAIAASDPADWSVRVQAKGDHGQAGQQIAGVARSDPNGLHERFLSSAVFLDTRFNRDGRETRGWSSRAHPRVATRATARTSGQSWWPPQKA